MVNFLKIQQPPISPWKINFKKLNREKQKKENWYFGSIEGKGGVNFQLYSRNAHEKITCKLRNERQEKASQRKTFLKRIQERKNSKYQGPDMRESLVCAENK